MVPSCEHLRRRQPVRVSQQAGCHAAKGQRAGTAAGSQAKDIPAAAHSPQVAPFHDVLAAALGVWEHQVREVQERGRGRRLSWPS